MVSNGQPDKKAKTIPNDDDRSDNQFSCLLISIIMQYQSQRMQSASRPSSLVSGGGQVRFEEQWAQMAPLVSVRGTLSSKIEWMDASFAFSIEQSVFVAQSWCCCWVSEVRKRQVSRLSSMDEPFTLAQTMDRPRKAYSIGTQMVTTGCWPTNHDRECGIIFFNHPRRPRGLEKRARDKERMSGTNSDGMAVL